MEREVGGGIGMGKTCKLKDVSFQCMKKKKKKLKKKKKKKNIHTKNKENKTNNNKNPQRKIQLENEQKI